MDQDAFAKQFYFSELGRRADEAMAAKVLSGLPSGRIPLGYLASANNMGFERDMEKAPSITQAFEMAANGMALRKILRAVEGLSTRSGLPLSSSTLYSLLTNPFYCGFVRYRGELHPGSHLPLVSRELYARVQQQPREKRRSVGPTSVGKHV